MTPVSSLSGSLRDTDINSSQTSLEFYRAEYDANGKTVDFRLAMLSAPAVDKWGKPQSELLNQSVSQLMRADDADYLSGQFSLVMKSGRAVRFDMSHPGQRDGASRTYEVLVMKQDDGVLVSYNDSDEHSFIAHVVDTTALRKVEQEKLHQGALLQTIIDSSQSGIVLYEIVHDEVSGEVVDFRFVLTNPANEQVVGRAKAELLGKSIYAIYPELMQTAWGEKLFACARTGDRQTFLFNYFNEGINGWFDISLVRHEQHILFTFSDVTALKEAELALRQQNDLLKEIVENGQTGMTLFDPIRDEAGEIIDFRYVFTNAVNARVMGRSVAELTGERLLTLFPTRPQTEWYANLMHTATTGESRSYLYELHTDRINGWFNTLFVKVGDQILYTYLDITPLKQAKQALQDQNDLLEQVMNTTPTVIALHESVRNGAGELIDFRLTHLNQKAADLLGHSLEEARIPLLSDYFPGVQKTPVFEHYRRVVEQSVPNSNRSVLETPLVRFIGSAHWRWYGGRGAGYYAHEGVAA